MMFTLQQALAWIDGARLGGEGATPVARVHTDTRTLQAGDLFVALRGERFDAAILSEGGLEALDEFGGIGGAADHDAAEARGVVVRAAGGGSR